MPQDIPLEASEELAFTPASLEHLGDAAPVFRLRAMTARDKRYLRRLHLEENVIYFNQSALRAEILRGLQSLWSPEAFTQHSTTIKEFWDAQDEWEQQKKVHDKEQAGVESPEPFPAFDYDRDIRLAVEELQAKVRESWPPLRRMIADNADFPELVMPLTVAVCVKSWDGLEVKADRERGYLTITGAEAIADALGEFEKERGLAVGVSGAELFIACNKRMYLDEEEAKNSASPSPSETTPPASSETTPSDAAGKSPASARSKKTPASA